jgi:MOSC domain-containing protein YiiM
MVYCTPTGLACDLPTETDLKDPDDPGAGQVHGGFDKALYVFPEEHYAEWLRELGEACLRDRSFGENWVIRGAMEAEVHLGDRWQLAAAEFEVSKVRTPCVTLEAYFGGRQHMVRRMTTNGLCGWYLRVRKPGLIPVSGTIQVTRRNLDGLTVAEAFAHKMRASAGT